MGEIDPLFEERKRDHIRIALDPRVQSSRTNGLEAVDLIHEALPELNFEAIDLSTASGTLKLKAPFFISSMTAGHQRGREINSALARAAERRGLLMGVGSQRRELEDPAAVSEWKDIRREAPKAVLAGNIGIAQVIEVSPDRIRALVEGLEASALFIHLNPLQECLQPEGTPQFRGGLQAIEKIVKTIGVPVIVKETGCGFSTATIARLDSVGVHAVDISGMGGTHWGRVEGKRAPENGLRAQAAVTFEDWGISTARSMKNALEAKPACEIWASGGVRNGLEIAKLVAMGAKLVGLAHPWLEAAVQSDADSGLEKLVDRLEFELKTSLFCTGARTPAELAEGRRWVWRT